jgi:hypothetical protein
MRATRPHGGRDQYCTGRTASSSRPKRRKLSRPDANFYSIRAFILSTNLLSIMTNVAIANTESLGVRSPSPIALFVVGELALRIPEDRNFGTEGEAIESGLKRTIAGRDAVMRSLIRAVYRFRDATLVAEKKDDFGSALQNLYRELERAENLVGPAG